jgi:hypothetical protein
MTDNTKLLIVTLITLVAIAFVSGCYIRGNSRENEEPSSSISIYDNAEEVFISVENLREDDEVCVAGYSDSELRVLNPSDKVRMASDTKFWLGIGDFWHGVYSEKQKAVLELSRFDGSVDYPYRQMWLQLCDVIY